jgi:D-arabinitol 4-dehydrogenase
MVDRITPRPPPELRARVKAATGRDDAAAGHRRELHPVGDRRQLRGRPPDWGSVGVELVESVQPYEEAKIRILNATHSCIAWAGTLAGLSFIHEGTHNAAIRKMAFDYVTDDVIPCLSPEPDRPRRVPRRGARPLRQPRHPRHQPARGGGRLLEDSGLHRAHRARAAGRRAGIDSVAMLPALFLAFLQRWHQGTLPYAYQDQGMDEAVAHAICDAADPVLALCADAGCGAASRAMRGWSMPCAVPASASRNSSKSQKASHERPPARHAMCC